MATAAQPAQPPHYLSSFGPDGTALAEFQRTGPIAVDQQTHAVYVRDPEAEALYRFDTNGSPLPFSGSAGYISGNEILGLPAPPSVGESEVAVNSSTHVVYVVSGNAVRAFQESGEPAEFTAGAGAGTNEIGGFARLAGVAVDANGAIYASDLGSGGSGAITIFTPSGEELTKFETEQPANIAVDSNGAVYVTRFEGPVFKFIPSEFPVTSTTTYSPGFEPFASDPATSVSVDPATNDVYITRLFIDPRIAWYDETGALIATFAGPGEEGEFFFSEGTAIDDASQRIFVSRNLFDGTSLVGIFGPEPKCAEAPALSGSYANPVTSDSADLHATVNPCSSETTYWFEFGASDCAVAECTRVPAGGVAVGSGHFPVAVSQVLSGLSPSTTYHYRIVAKNGFGTSYGPDRSFTTQGGGTFSLSDGRVWEMVSPANKRGAKMVASPGGITEAEASGDGLAYLTLGTIESSPEGNRAAEVSSVLARRTAAGWQSKDITPPHTEAAQIQLAAEYKLFSPSLSEALMEPRDRTPLSPIATEMTPYLRNNAEPPSFTPLLNPGNVSSGTRWAGPEAFSEYVTIEGANSELTHVALDSRLPLAPGDQPFALYVWAGGSLKPVSELPAGEGVGVITGVLGSKSISVRHALSDDGSHIFWSGLTNGEETNSLYLRDTLTQQSVRLDVPQPGALGEPNPVFQAATPDGSAVFFTDSQQLTGDASPSGRDLYRCEIGQVGADLGCVSLTDITAPRPGSGESTEVKEVIPGIGDDGKSAYFVATSVLDTSQNANGESAQAGEPNLYRWDQSKGVRFIATLAEEDGRDWGKGPLGGSVAKLSAWSSPNGRFLAFMSQRSLTGYENVNPSSPESIEEAFLYDAAADSLVCISCKPTGAAPDGELGEEGGAENGASAAVDLQGNWTGRWVAAILPEGSFRVLGGPSLYQPRAVLNNGRTFFNSVDPLVPADSNRQWDVYQYEPEGVGGCSGSSASSATSHIDSGCVSLISSGTSEGASAFLDASTSGDDVFFLTTGALSVLDEDTALDVYDARVGGTAAIRALPNNCDGGCQEQALPPAATSPASAAFNGPGNLRHRRRHCPHGERRVRRHGKTICKRKHKRHHRRSGSGRRVER